MFSVLAALNTGGLYVPATYIAFLRRLYFLAASSQPTLFDGCPSLAVLSKICALPTRVNCPLVTRSLRLQVCRPSLDCFTLS